MFIVCHIAGTKFRDIESQVAAARLKEDEALVLVPEPSNEHDPHAVKVMTPDGLHLGYVPRIYSAEVAQAIAQKRELLCSVSHSGRGKIVIESVPPNGNKR